MCVSIFEAVRQSMPKKSWVKSACSCFQCRGWILSQLPLSEMTKVLSSRVTLVDALIKSVQGSLIVGDWRALERW